MQVPVDLPPVAQVEHRAEVSLSLLQLGAVSVGHLGHGGKVDFSCVVVWSKFNLPFTRGWVESRLAIYLFTV